MLQIYNNAARNQAEMNILNIPKELCVKIQGRLHKIDIKSLACVCKVLNNYKSDEEYVKLQISYYQDLLSISYPELLLLIPEINNENLLPCDKVALIKKFIYTKPCEFPITITRQLKTKTCCNNSKMSTKAWAIPLFLLLKWANINIPNRVRNNNLNKYVAYIREMHTSPETLINVKDMITNSSKLTFSFLGMTNNAYPNITNEIEKPVSYTTYKCGKAQNINDFVRIFGKLVVPMNIDESKFSSVKIYTTSITKCPNQTNKDTIDGYVYLSSINRCAKLCLSLKGIIEHTYCERYIN
jgi:hypothetical protein